MLYTVQTQTDIQTIKDEIQAKAKARGFGILKEYPFKNILEEKGHPIEHDITVYELCNPAAAQKVLSLYPELSIYLPCRISLYTKDNLTILSAMDMDDMIQDFDLDSDTKAHMDIIFEQFKQILSSWN